MIKKLIKFAFVMMPFSILAQDMVTTPSFYISPYVGAAFQGSTDVRQSGTAHKRGDFNEFDTDFNLQVKVEGTSESAIGTTYGFTFGSVWNKANRKLNPGFEVDVFRMNSSHQSGLSNPSDEEVTDINGPNGDSVVAFIDEHYGAGKHRFSNSMPLDSWNTAVNFTLSYDISSKISANGAIGLGFTAMTLKEAESLQVGPAASDPGYETTNDNGGGPVNHFNGRPESSVNLFFTQIRLGAKIQLAKKAALRIDARGIFAGEGEFVFGSTKYSDHPPTDSWMYVIDRSVIYSITAGLCFHLN